MKRTIFSALAVASLLILPTTAQAVPISGTIGWTGDGVLVFSTGGGAPGTNYIDWCPVNVAPEPGAGCGISPTGIGTIEVSSRSGSFLVNPDNSLGTIKDSTDAPGNPAPYTTVVPGPNNVPGYLDFSDPWLYTLTSITPQVCGGPDQFCTGMFRLVQIGNNVSVNIAGTGTITAGGDVTPFDMLLTGNFTNTTIAAVVAAGASPEGAFTFSTSGELTAQAIPEPATLLTFGVGTALLAAARKRRSKKNGSAA